MIFRRQNTDALTAQINVFTGQHVGALHRQVFTGGHADIAQYAADGAADVGEGFARIGDFGAAAAGHDTHAAGAHQAGFCLLIQVRFTLALLRAADGEVLFCPQVDILVCHHIAADDRDIFATDIKRTGRQHGADRQRLANTVFAAGGGAGGQPFFSAGMIALLIMLFSLGGEGDIAARRQCQRAVSLYRAGAEGDVFCRLQMDIAGGV
ncbi:Uncharacterised protein [Yersinia kristensenii]|nr:Uncharacterised protein [Yersinia kristensenii]